MTILSLTSCVDSKKSIQKQTRIDLETVDYIYIKKSRNGTDSINLNKEQIELFVKEWNSAEPVGLVKMGPKFWLTLKLKNDSIRMFRVNRSFIKEKKDWTYSLSDSTVINSFWKPIYSFDESQFNK